MSDFANWFKKHENRSDSKEMWLLKGLIDGQIEPGHAAKSLTMKINLKNTRDLYEISQTILSLALHSLDSAVQENSVELAADSSNLFDGPEEGNPTPWRPWRDGRDHWGYVGILNEFSARLTEANLCDGTVNAIDLCNTLLEDHKLGENPERFDVVVSKMAQKLRNNPTLFTVALSAAARYMIYAASNLYDAYKTRRTYAGLGYRWEDWKTVFKEAETGENGKARNDALAAVVAIDTAERTYTPRRMPEVGRLTTSGMAKKWDQSGSFDGKTATGKN